jgi:hypothetical protein
VCALEGVREEVSSFPHIERAIRRAHDRKSNYAITPAGQARIAASIAEDPEDLLDALVADGILVSALRVSAVEALHGELSYTVPIKHEHEWYVRTVWESRGLLGLGCKGCRSTPQVPNKFPIEVPE